MGCFDHGVLIEMSLLHRAKQTSLVPSGDPAPNKPKKPLSPPRQNRVLSLPHACFLQICLGLVVRWGTKKVSFESIWGLPAPDWTIELVRTFHRVPHVQSRLFGDSTWHSSLESFEHTSPHPRAAARIHSMARLPPGFLSPHSTTSSVLWKAPRTHLLPSQQSGLCSTN